MGRAGETAKPVTEKGQNVSIKRMRRSLCLVALVPVISSCLSAPLLESSSSGADVGDPSDSFEFDPVYAEALFSSIPLERIPPRLPSSEYNPRADLESYFVEFDQCENFDWYVSNQSPFAISGTGDAYIYSILDTITDQHGSFVRVHASLRDEYVNSIPLLYSHEDTSIGGSGLEPIQDFTDDQMRSAIRLASDFILNESLDSMVLDNITLYPEWLAEVGPRYYSEGLLFRAQREYERSNPLFEEWLLTLDSQGLRDQVPPESFDMYRGTLGLIQQGATEFRVPWSPPEDSTISDFPIAAVPRPLMRDGHSRVGNKHVHGFRFHKAALGANSPTRIIVEVKSHAVFFWDQAVEYLASGRREIDEILQLDLIERLNKEQPPGSMEFGLDDFPPAPIPEGLLSYPTAQLTELELVLKDGEWKISDLIQSSSWTSGIVECGEVGVEFDGLGNMVYDDDGCPVVTIAEGARGQLVVPAERQCEFNTLDGEYWQGVISDADKATLFTIYDSMRYVDRNLVP
jgi:hypothetical protein